MSSTIFVGNLNFATTDEELRDMFGEIGEVVDVHIPKDRETGRPRGFAFVRFSAEEHAKQAIEQFHGRELGGRALRLDIAEDRPRAPRQRREFGTERRGRDLGGGRESGRRDRDSGRHDRDFGRAEFGPPPEDYGREDFDRNQYNYDREEYEDDGSRGGRGGRPYDKPKRPKGSRRGLRGKKRSL